MQRIAIKNNLNTEFSIEHKDNEEAISIDSKDLSKVKSVDTLADLKALTSTPPTIWVSGYHTKSDSAFGSHIFEWDSTSTEDDNGGTIIKLDNVGTGRYKLRYDGSVNVKWFGAKGDANEIDGSGTDSTLAIRKAIKYSEENEKSLYIDGLFKISGELVIRKPLYMFGNGNSLGYADLTKVNIISGFVATGVASKRIHTRVSHRASSLDPQDTPMSVAINNQAENTHISNLAVFNYFNRADMSPTNYGDDWDIGIFNGCRVNFKLSDVHVLGYFNEACFWQDVTRASNLPELLDLDGTPYEEGSIPAGADGLILDDCVFYGGKWGVKVQGAKLPIGVTNPTDRSLDYYDEILGETVSDWRGNYGNSDFDMYSCSVYGTDHFSRQRRNDIDPLFDFRNDTAGGAMSIDGLAGNSAGMIQGMRFISSRFSSMEPFRVRLGYSNRTEFIGCHIEARGSSSTRDTNGNYINTNNYGADVDDKTGAQSYGAISRILEAESTLIIGSNVAITYTSKQNWFESLKYLDEFGAAKGGGLRFDGDILMHNESVIKNKYDDLDLRAAEGKRIRFRTGNETQAYLSDTGITLGDGNYIKANNYRPTSDRSDIDLRHAPGGYIRFREDTTSIAFLNSSFFRPDQDDSMTIGTGASKWKEIYLTNDPIITSDEREKTFLTIEDAEKACAIEVKKHIRKFKWNKAIEEKGDAARIHYGVNAQQVRDIFSNHGLDAHSYGLFTYDEWKEELDEDNNVIQEAGNRYGIRYSELLCFIIGAI